MDNWQSVVVSTNTPLIEAVTKIDVSGIQFCMVINSGGKLEGGITDGDIRRSILRGKDLQIPVSEVMNSKVTTAPISMPPGF